MAAAVGTAAAAVPQFLAGLSIARLCARRRCRYCCCMLLLVVLLSLSSVHVPKVCCVC